MHWLSVRPSLCLSRRSTAATAAGEFAAERPAGRQYKSIAAGALQAPCCSKAPALSSKYDSVTLRADGGLAALCVLTNRIE